MATNYTSVTPILGVNLEGNEDPAGTSDGNSGAPRLALNTPVLISGNRVAIYCVAGAVINPSSTVDVAADGTAAPASGGTGNFVSLNIATASTGQLIWCRDKTALAV